MNKEIVFNDVEMMRDKILEGEENKNGRERKATKWKLEIQCGRGRVVNRLKMKKS